MLRFKFSWLLYVLFYIKTVKSQENLRDEVSVTKNSTIEITSYQRTYRHGPIESRFQVSSHDEIMATVGGIKNLGDYFGNDFSGSDPEQPKTLSETFVRQWAMWEVDTKKSCVLGRVYNFGEEAMFSCRSKGIYRIYVYDEMNYDWDAADIPSFNSDGNVKVKKLSDLFPKSSKNPDTKLFWSNRHRVQPFHLYDPLQIDTQLEFIWENFAAYIDQHKEMVAISDPISLGGSEYCYYWNYRIVKVHTTGVVDGVTVPNKNSKEDVYTKYDIYVWIVESASLTYDNLATSYAAHDIKVSEYSKLITNKFEAKGLVPCIRKSHEAIEVVQVKWWAEEDTNNRQDYPHWRITMKVHTDTVISTLSDITFTISSRQRVAHYRCFVGDTRIFLGIHSFEFLHSGENNKNKVKFEFSYFGRTTTAQEYIRKNFDRIYGHGLVWGGSLKSRLFQPGSTRTDLITIVNPCKAQEFIAIAGGRLYAANHLLELRMASLQRILLPGLSGGDVTQGEFETNSVRHQEYYSAVDAAFTPTHMVFLMEESDVYFHPYQLSSKGVGHLEETQKFKLSGLVKRRWCAHTGYLTHNMLVPAFSSSGNFILIQLYPIEGSVNVWSKPLSESCAAEGQGFVGFVTEEDLLQETLETAIHLHEAVSRSDDVGRAIPPPKVEKPVKVEKNKEELETYLANNGELLDEDDPHFSDKATNPASKRSGSDYKYFNHAVIYKLDESGDKNKIKALLTNNGIINLKDVDTDDIQFTAVEKRFIIGSKFTSDDIRNRNFVALIATMTALNYPVKINIEKIENEDLVTSENFPGCLLVRREEFQVHNVYPEDPDDIVGDHTVYDGNTNYPFKIYTLNTALPTYVVALGNVYVFASLDGRFASPIVYYKRSYILSGDLSDLDFTPIFTNSTMGQELSDIVVTEQGTLSVLWRRKKMDITNSLLLPEAQSIAIGSVFTLEPLREVRPFVSSSNIFQWVTPDSEILYGKYQLQQRPRYKDCIRDVKPELGGNLTGCVWQPSNKDVTPWCTEDTALYHQIVNNPVVYAYFKCRPWKIKLDELHSKNNELLTRVEHFNDAFENDKRRLELPLCKNPEADLAALESENPDGCYLNLRTAGLQMCDPDEIKKEDRTPPRCFEPPAFHSSRVNLHSIELLAIPYYNLLNGNLEFTTVSDESRITLDSDANAINPDDEVICPFAGFKVINTDFDYAEIGYSTRITAEVSYFGKNIPTEADLLVEFENVIGIKVTVTASLLEERDQTTVIKTIDIEFQMTDIDLKKMEGAYKKRKASGDNNDDAGGDTNQQKDDARIFSITLRPSIVNMYCNKDEFLRTLQINVGCNPFTKLRLIYEATPLNRIELGKSQSSDPLKIWSVSGDYLKVPRDDVHHRQRKTFGCAVKGQSDCLIPYANLFQQNIFNISWRDPIVPVFEQFLTGYTRRVTGNVIIYDLLGDNVTLALNLTLLKAGCYNNADNWYKSLLQEQLDRRDKNIISTEYEDIYAFYKDCYDQTVPRETPMLLSNESFRLHNITNKNAIRFARKPNPRNKIYVFRATVVNTYYNRFTFCNKLDTFFLVRIVGIPKPRESLQWWYYIVMSLAVLAVLGLTYVHFSFCYPWKGDIATPPISFRSRPSANPDDVTEEDILNEEYLRDEEHMEFDFTQRVRNQQEGFFERFANKIYALTKWKNKAREQIDKRKEEEKSDRQAGAQPSRTNEEQNQQGRKTNLKRS